MARVTRADLIRRLEQGGHIPARQKKQPLVFIRWTSKNGRTRSFDRNSIGGIVWPTFWLLLSVIFLAGTLPLVIQVFAVLGCFGIATLPLALGSSKELSTRQLRAELASNSKELVREAWNKGTDSALTIAPSEPLNSFFLFRADKNTTEKDGEALVSFSLRALCFDIQHRQWIPLAMPYPDLLPLLATASKSKRFALNRVAEPFKDLSSTFPDKAPEEISLCLPYLTDRELNSTRLDDFNPFDDRSFRRNRALQRTEFSSESNWQTLNGLATSGYLASDFQALRALSKEFSGDDFIELSSAQQGVAWSFNLPVPAYQPLVQT